MSGATQELPRVLYRGGKLGSGPTWWTPDRKYAEHYAYYEGKGEVHEMRADWSGSRVLDLTPVGVVWSDEVAAEILEEAGVAAVNGSYGDLEVYQVVEAAKFQDSAWDSGVVAIGCEQWNYDYGEDPVEAWLVNVQHEQEIQ